jgi:hypothetical protein
MGKYLSTESDRGRCLLVEIWAWWFHASFLGNHYWENHDGYVSAPMEGHEGNHLARTQIQSLRMSGPLDGLLSSTSC